MSETLTVYDTSAYETETASYGNETYAAESSPSSQEEEPWGTDLMNYVMVNQYVIVRCPWMGGEVTLGEAMTSYNYPPNMTEKDIPSVIAVVNELLANRVLEEEAEKDAENSEEDKTAKKEEVDDKPKEQFAEKGEVDQKTKVKTQSPEEKTTPISVTTEKQARQQIQAIKPSGQTRINKDQPEAPASLKSEKLEIKLPVQVPSKAEVVAPPSVLTPAKSTAENPAQVTATAASVETDPRPAITVSESTQPQIETAPIIKHEAELVNLQSARENENGAPPLPEAAFINDDTESREIGITDLEDTAALEDIIGLPSDYQAQETLEYSLVDVDYKFTDDSLKALDEVEVSIEHHEKNMFQAEAQFNDIGLENEETVNSLQENGSGSTGEAEIVALEQLTQINVPVREIEASLICVAEQIESSEPETVEIVHQILDKIVSLQAMLENQTTKETITEVEIQEKMEEQFTELFNRLGIDFTPELIDSLVLLTIKWHLGEEIKSRKQEEETDETPQGYGTHEIIKKLLSGLGKIKKTMANAYVIGKSILRLYCFDFPTELKKRLAA